MSSIQNILTSEQEAYSVVGSNISVINNPLKAIAETPLTDKASKEWRYHSPKKRCPILGKPLIYTSTQHEASQPKAAKIDFFFCKTERIFCNAIRVLGLEGLH